MKLFSRCNAVQNSSFTLPKKSWASRTDYLITGGQKYYGKVPKMRAIPVKSFFNGKIKVNSYHRYIKRVDFVCCANNYACSKLSRLLTFLLRADVIDQV